ncbi:MAG: hypothetical protein AB9856_14490 [Cellulosilyticaceae bacterium]
MINLSKQELDVLHCRHGTRQEFYKLECLDFYGIRRFDLDLIDGNITVDCNADIQRTAMLTFKNDNRIDYLNDKCKSYMGIKIDSTLRWYPLGVFLMVKPKIQKNICSCQCYDETMYIKQDRIQEPKLFLKGANYGDVLKYFLISCGITKINIQSTTLVLTADIVCDYSKNKLEWFNYFADQINYTHLATDENGWFVSKKYTEPSPNTVNHIYKDDDLSIITGGLDIVMDYYNVPNAFTRIVSNPNVPQMVSTYINRDPTSKFSVQGRHGKKISDISTIDNVANQAELDNLVRKLAFNSVQIEQEVSFNTLNMPNHSIKDILDLRHKDLKGIFIEQKYSMQLKAEQAMNMRHTCKRLVRLQ